MSIRWWRRDLGRDPAFDDLSDAQRVVVRARVAIDSVRRDRVANRVLAVWFVMTGVAVVAFALGAPAPQRAWGPIGIYLMIPLYLRGWHHGLALKMRHRTILAVVREERRTAIDTALARGSRP